MFGRPSLEGVKPGDKVAMMHSGYQRGPEKIGTVAKVLKPYIELTDGSRWDRQTGDKRPRPTGYTHLWIEPLTDEHRGQLRFRHLTNRIMAWSSKELRDGKVELKVLDAIAQAIWPEEAKDGA